MQAGHRRHTVILAQARTQGHSDKRGTLDSAFAPMTMKSANDAEPNSLSGMSRQPPVFLGGFATGGGVLSGYLHHCAATQRQHSGRRALQT